MFKYTRYLFIYTNSFFILILIFIFIFFGCNVTLFSEGTEADGDGDIDEGAEGAASCTTRRTAHVGKAGPV